LRDLFWLTLSCIKGVGSKTLLQIYETDPTLHFNNYLERVKTFEPKRIVRLISQENIEHAQKIAVDLIKQHEENKIAVIPISSERYPKYLRLINDPPKVLYAKGNLALLEEENTLAIVGTREPTQLGMKASQKISYTFAKMNYTIVSGLALGVDTAAHEGALQASEGKTIAVLAGDLTQIYPAKNKGLAREILNRDGLLISETPIGQINNRGNFVKRDRIQSGLSLGVCPVQTPIKSGTQHTISYAREQKRYLFTPIPLKKDEGEDAIQGNLLLIEDGIPVLKDKQSYAIIDNELLRYKKILHEEHKQRFEKKKHLKTSLEENEICEQLNIFDLENKKQ